MLKKDIKAVWDRCIETRRVKPEDKEVILAYLKTVPDYQKLASQPNASLKVALKNFGRFDAWVLILNNFLPVTKKQAFKSSKKNPKAEIYRAMRNDISHQILRFRGSTTFPVTCYLSGETLTSWSEVDIDHVYPFSRLVQDWMKENGLDFPDIKIKGRANARTMADEIHKKSWQEYHFLHANLKCTSKSENRRKGKKIIES